MRFLLTGFLVVLIMSFHMPSAMAQPCPADGDVNQDGRLTPGDALLVFRHFLGIVDPPLTACQQDRANVIKPNSTPLTPEDALCIIQEFLRLPSCLAAQSVTSDETDIRVLVNTPFPLNVDIVDAADQPVEEAQVSFRITAGGGSLSTTTVSTDADGKATTTLTVGALPGLNVVEAQVAGLAPLTFTIIGVIPENVRALVEARGIPLAVTQGASIDIPLIVQVEDQFGVPVAEVEVTADIFQGETQTMTLLARTNVQGEASLHVQAVLGDEDIVAKVSLPGQTIVVPLVINNTIVAPNAAPVVASPGALMADEGEAVALQLVAIDPDGDPLVFGATNLPLGLSIGPDTGLIAGTVDPAAAQVSPYIVTITATDGTVTTTVSFVLTVRNPSPVLATIGNQAIDAGSTQAVAVTANDPDGDELTLTATGLPTFAVFTDNGDGTGTLILAPGSDDAGIFPGVAITVTDTSSPRGTDSQTFTLTVNTMNRRPVAEAGADQTVPLGVTVSLDGSASTDPDGDVPLGFQWALVSIPIGSRATLSDNNTIRPIFMTDVTGLYVVELQVNDGRLTANPDTVLINAVTTQVNNLPIGLGDAYTVNEDNTLTTTAANGVLANDGTVDGDLLTARLVRGVLHGTLEAFNADGSFTYRPNGNFNGVDSFTYTANGANVASNILMVSITVTPVNDVPRAIGDTYSVAEDTALTIRVANGVLANDSDPHDVPSDTLVATRVSDPSHGTLDAFHSDGSFIYRPHAHFTGIDTFTYQVSDDGGTANGGTDTGNIATVSLTVISVNDPPVATADVYALNEDTALAVTTAAGVLANDSDPHDVPPDRLVATRVSSPSRGELEAFRSDGSFTYRPHAHFVGTDTFTYQVSDNGGTTNGGTDTGNIVTVSLTVIAVNDPPVATADAYHLSDDDILEIPVEAGVLANDSDPNDVPPDRLVATRLRDPSHGVLEAFHPDGSFTYRPDEGYAGTDSFTYQVSDDGGTTNGGIDTGNIATVTISVENCPLIADAGQDQTVFVADTVTLTGSGSCDELLFQWSIIDTPPDSSAILSDPEAIMPTFVPDLQGTYVIELIVSDGTTNSEPVEIRITAVATAVIAKGIGLENPDIDPSFSLTIPDAPLKAFLTWQQIVGRNGMANANLTLRKTVTDASGDVVIEDKELSQRAGSPPEGSTDGYREGSVRCFLTDISDFISPGTTNTFTVLGVDTTFIPGAGIVVVSPIIPDETVEFDEAESGQPLSTIAKLTAGSVHGSRRHVEIQTGCDFFFFGAEGYENSDVITFDFAPAPVERQARITFLVGDAQSGNNARDNQILYFPDAYAPLYDPRCSYQGQPQCILGQNGTGLESNDGEHWDTFGRNSGLLPSDPNFNPGSEPSSDPDLRGVVTIPPCATFASFQLLSPDANLTGLSATVSMAVFEIETTETTGPSIECYYDYDPGQTCLYESC